MNINNNNKKNVGEWFHIVQVIAYLPLVTEVGMRGQMKAGHSSTYFKMERLYK